MPPLRHARYGPSDRYPGPPPAGMCLSAFAIVKRGSKVLLGTPREHARWPEDWMVSMQGYDKEEREQFWQKPRLPSAYLHEGEHPDAALKRIVREQLGVRTFKVGKPEVSSWVAPSDWYPGNQHWDVVFTYRVQASAPARLPPWWSELGWKDTKELRAKDFGWNADYVRSLGLAR